METKEPKSEHKSEHKSGEHECCMKKAEQGGGSMKQYLMLGAIALLLVAVIVQSFQITALKDKETASAITGNAVDMSSWTADEKMQYEHHGVLPTRAQGSAPASSGMVGGC